VVVRDEVVALAGVLQGDVVADRAEVVTQVQLAGRLHAGEDAFASHDLASEHLTTKHTKDTKKDTEQVNEDRSPS
jgi:hypothetical protein